MGHEKNPGSLTFSYTACLMTGSLILCSSTLQGGKGGVFPAPLGLDHPTWVGSLGLINMLIVSTLGRFDLC